MCTPTSTVISHQQQPQDQSRENVGVLSVGRCGAGTIIILLVQNFLLDNWFFKTKKTSLIVLNKRERTCFHNYRACESSLSDVLSEEGAPNTPSRRLTDDLPWIFAEWPVL
jgi:hypothetical protein